MCRGQPVHLFGRRGNNGVNGRLWDFGGSVPIVKEKCIYLQGKWVRSGICCRCTRASPPRQADCPVYARIELMLSKAEWLPERNDVTGTGPTRYRSHRTMGGDSAGGPSQRHGYPQLTLVSRLPTADSSLRTRESEDAMLTDHTTLTQFLIEDRRRYPSASGELNSLILDVALACKAIAKRVAYGLLGPAAPTTVQGESRQSLDSIANDLFLRANEWGGLVCGMVSKELAEPYLIPEHYPRGKYLLAFDPLDGSSNIDVNLSVGSIFSI